MFRKRKSTEDVQQQFWIETKRLPKATANPFYRKLDKTLDETGFSDGVRELCKPAYADASKGGRPGIDPLFYFKMLMIGFFENLPSERSIASRCADSLSLRVFLGYDPEEETPDHSSLSVIRTRLGEDVYQAALELVLVSLHANGLLKGRNLGIDLSVIEANASLRAATQVRFCPLFCVLGKSPNLGAPPQSFDSGDSAGGGGGNRTRE